MKERRKILVVDDDDQFRHMVRDILSTSDYDVSDVNRGEKALSMMEEESFGLVITDLLMPGIGGFKFIRRMRQMGAEAKIIAMSGGSNKTSVDECLFLAGRFKADAVLKKPFSMSELMAHIEALIP